MYYTYEKLDKRRIQLKRRSRRYGWDYDVSFRKLKELWSHNKCFFTLKKLNIDNFSIIRLNKDIGFIDSNMVICDDMVRVALKDVSIEELKQMTLNGDACDGLTPKQTRLSYRAITRYNKTLVFNKQEEVLKMSEQKRSIEELVDEMISFTEKAGGNIDMYVEMCEKSVAEAKSELDGSKHKQEIYEDSLEFLRIAEERRDA